MTMIKIAVSLPEPLVRKARQSVRAGVSPSVSAYVARAMEEKAKNDDLDALLAEMLAETGGPPTRAEIEATDRVLGVGGPSQRRRRARAAQRRR